MNIVLSIKTFALLAFVAISTASIVQLPLSIAAHPGCACTVAAVTALIGS